MLPPNSRHGLTIKEFVRRGVQRQYQQAAALTWVELSRKPKVTWSLISVRTRNAPYVVFPAMACCGQTPNEPRKFNVLCTDDWFYLGDNATPYITVEILNSLQNGDYSSLRGG
jgi:hypothetical protein